MKQLYPDLWQTNLFKSGMLNSHAYLLQHPDGNILFYNTNDETDLDKIEQLGGIKYQLLTHRDEAGTSLLRIKERFKSLLVFTEPESQAISKYAQADLFFEPTDNQFAHIEVLHTPGHTEGSVSFVYQSPYGKTYLFTGDTFFQWEGRWATLVLDSAGGNKASLKSSLHKLRALKPDVVMSSGFVGDKGVVEINEAEWLNAIDNEINNLK
jgi:glyoxylase-like metal-dependent hydrolase (beta-lactamase superfamily II)